MRSNKITNITFVVKNLMINIKMMILECDGTVEKFYSEKM